MITTYTIATAWAQALHDDSALTLAFTQAFSRQPKIRVGYNPADLPSDADAPFIVLLPVETEVPESQSKVAHTVRIVIGINDGEWEAGPWGSNLRGLRRLSELIPMTLRALEDAVPDTSWAAHAVEYDIDDFPLLHGNVGITVNVRQAVGQRR